MGDPGGLGGGPGGSSSPVVALDGGDGAGLRGVVEAGLVGFNEQRTGRPAGNRPLGVAVRHPGSGAVVGGLCGWTGYTQLHVELLFVPEGMRGQGVGRAVLRLAESEAARRGCRGAWLDTYSFQARGFYERLGYVVFGVIEEYLPGQSRLFLRKSFAGVSGGEG